ARDHKGQPRPAYRLKFPQTQDYTALPFSQELDGVGENEDDDDQHKQWTCTLHSYVSSATALAEGALAPFLSYLFYGERQAIDTPHAPRCTSFNGSRAPRTPQRPMDKHRACGVEALLRRAQGAQQALASAHGLASHTAHRGPDYQQE